MTYEENFTRNKHVWTPEEDYICCENYLLYFLRNDYMLDFEDVVYNILLKIPQISKVSLVRKLRNIKALCNKYKIKDYSGLLPLIHYSEQNEIVFKRTILRSDIQELINKNS